jgi:hypothetical protein
LLLSLKSHAATTNKNANAVKVEAAVPTNRLLAVAKPRHKIRAVVQQRMLLKVVAKPKHQVYPKSKSLA